MTVTWLTRAQTSGSCCRRARGGLPIRMPGIAPPLGHLPLFPAVSINQKELNCRPAPAIADRRHLQWQGPCNSGRTHGSGLLTSMLLARYFTHVKVQQKLCTDNGYERVTPTLPNLAAVPPDEFITPARIPESPPRSHPSPHPPRATQLGSPPTQAAPTARHSPPA